jgi:phage terminase large subunit-like protein
LSGEQKPPAEPGPVCPECGYPGTRKLIDMRVAWEQMQRELRALRERPAREREAALGYGWTPEAVCAARATEVPDLERVVVAVSPALPPDETGIIVAGRDADGDCYVLADYSEAMKPDACAWRAIGAYRDHKADVVCGVANVAGDYLGALLERTFERVVRPGEYAAYAMERNRAWAFEYRPVTLMRAFADRLKLVKALYEPGCVHHVGAFSELEDRMFTWMPGDGKPMERIEALVVALTELTSAT